MTTKSKKKMTECICLDKSGYSTCGVKCPVHGKKEKKQKVIVKYPEVRIVLQTLFREGYRAGAKSSGNGDGYDYSTAYEELEPIISTLLSEQKKELETVSYLLGRDDGKEFARKELGEKLWRMKRIMANSFPDSDVVVGYNQAISEIAKLL